MVPKWNKLRKSRDTDYNDTYNYLNDEIKLRATANYSNLATGKFLSKLTSSNCGLDNNGHKKRPHTMNAKRLNLKKPLRNAIRTPITLD